MFPSVSLANILLTFSGNMDIMKDANIQLVNGQHLLYQISLDSS